MIGQTMRAAVCREHGPPEALVVESVARPEPGAGEVLVRVGAAAAVRAIVPDGADVVIDPVGGPASERALRSVRWGGRFVTLGFASGDIPRIPLNLVLLKGVTVKGFEIRTFGLHAPDLAARDRAELLDLLASGRVAPHIDAVYPLDDVASALRKVADRESAGKVLVDPTR